MDQTLDATNFLGREVEARRNGGPFTYCFYIFIYVLILYNTVFTYYSSKDQLKTLMPKEEGKKKKDERREMGRYSE